MFIVHYLRYAPRSLTIHSQYLMWTIKRNTDNILAYPNGQESGEDLFLWTPNYNCPTSFLSSWKLRAAGTGGGFPQRGGKGPTMIWPTSCTSTGHLRAPKDQHANAILRMGGEPHLTAYSGYTTISFPIWSSTIKRHLNPNLIYSNKYSELLQKDPWC